MGVELQIILVALMVSFSCVIPGSFLVLKKVSMLSDAISHAIILGIVLSFFIFKDIHSPWLIVGATFSGLIMVWLTEKIIQTKEIKRDAAIALIFPLFFSLSIILINVYATNYHLDQDMVISGEIIFTPLVFYEIASGFKIPKSFVINGIIFLINLLLLLLFYKELKISSLEENYANDLGFNYKKINTGLVFSSSLTAVGAFEAVGTILVIGFFILPSSISYLWVKSIKAMIILSFVICFIAVIMGYLVSYIFNLSVAGVILMVLGFFLLSSIFLSPKNTLLQKRNKKDF